MALEAGGVAQFRGLLDELAGLGVFEGGQQGLDLFSQSGVVTAGGVEEGGALGRGPLEGAGQDGLDPGPGLGARLAHESARVRLAQTDSYLLPFFPKRSMRYAIRGPPSPSYASSAMARVNGSR